MEFKLKLKSKKLDSGRFQVSFSTEGFRSDFYGHLLAEPKTSLREVVETIQANLGAVQSPASYFQPTLFSLGSRHVNSGRFMIFRRQDLLTSEIRNYAD